MRKLLTVLMLLLSVCCGAQTLPGSPPYVAYFQPINFSQMPLPNRLCKIQAFGIGYNISNAPVVYDVGAWYTDNNGWLYITNPIVANWVITITAPPQATTLYFPLSNTLSGNYLVTNWAYTPTNLQTWQVTQLNIANVSGSQGGLSGSFSGGVLNLTNTNGASGGGGLTNGCAFTTEQLSIYGSNSPPSKASSSLAPYYGYPSQITVGGIAGTITGNIYSMAVYFYGIQHTEPAQLTIVLQGPTGVATYLMSGCGAANSFGPVNLVFSQSAGSSLPSSGTITAGTYLPTSYNSYYVITNTNPTTPGTPYQTNLNVFNGTSANGAWSLWVIDSGQFASGDIMGWGLQFNGGPIFVTNITITNTIGLEKMGLGATQVGTIMTLTQTNLNGDSVILAGTNQIPMSPSAGFNVGIFAGSANNAATNAHEAFIGGGENNTITGASYVSYGSAIIGGYNNLIESIFPPGWANQDFMGGGSNNQIQDTPIFAMLGGNNNLSKGCNGGSSGIVGGTSNLMGSEATSNSFISGGLANSNWGTGSGVEGGASNVIGYSQVNGTAAEPLDSVILSGYSNTIGPTNAVLSGTNDVVAGSRATDTNNTNFLINESATPHSSSNNYAVEIYADNGFFVNGIKFTNGGGGGGSGTVTSVGLNADAAGVISSVTGSPVTISGSFTPTFNAAIQTLSSNNGSSLTDIVNVAGGIILTNATITNTASSTGFGTNGNIVGSNITALGAFTGNGAGLTLASSNNYPTNTVNLLNNNIVPGEGANSQEGYFSNQVSSNLAVNVDLTYNACGLGHLSLELAGFYTNQIGFTNNICWLYFGDSTGADTFLGLLYWLQSNTLAGVQLGGPFIGQGYSYLDAVGAGGNANVPGYTDTNFWISPASWSLVSTDCPVVFYGAPSDGPTAFYGNRIQVWYYLTNGVSGATIQYSPDDSTWTTLGTINADNAAGGMQVTNFNVPLGYHYAQISSVTGNFRMPDAGFGIYNTNLGAGAMMYDMHAPGLQLSDWLAVGSNNICCLLTNVNPTVIVYQQTKGIYNSAGGFGLYPQYAAYVNNTNLVYCDNVLGAAQAAENGVSDLPYGYHPQEDAAQALFIRNVAITNNWTFWDNYTPFSVRSNLDAMGVTLNDPHFNTFGQKWSFQVFEQELHLADIYLAAGQLYPQTGHDPHYISTSGGNGTNTSFYGSFSVTPTNYPNNPIVFSSYYQDLPGISFSTASFQNSFAIGNSHAAGQDITCVNGLNGIRMSVGGGTGGEGLQYQLYNDGSTEITCLSNNNADPGANIFISRAATNIFQYQVVVSNGISGNGAGLTNLQTLIAGAMLTNLTVTSSDNNFALLVNGDAFGDQLAQWTPNYEISAITNYIQIDQDADLIGNGNNSLLWHGAGTFSGGLTVNSNNDGGLLTGSAAVTFTNVVTETNLGNVFGGTFNGNGAGLTNIMPTGLVAVSTNFSSYLFPHFSFNITSSGANEQPAANSVYVCYMPVFYPMTITNICYRISGTDAGGHLGISIYNMAGSLISDSGPLSEATSGVFCSNMTPRVTLQPGTYLIGWNADNTTASSQMAIISTANEELILNAGTTVVMGTATNAASNGQNPSTLGGVAAGYPANGVISCFFQ